MGLGASLCGVKREIWGPNRPHDAHNAGPWGAAGHFKSAINPNKNSKYTLWAVFVAVETSVDRICTV